MQNTSIRALPDFMQGASIYQIFLRQFTREGTLRAASRMIPHIAAMQFKVIYLAPMFEMDDDMDRDLWSPRQKQSGFNNPKNPYRMKDYFKVDPEYGTLEDLTEFVEQAHRYGMYVILDLVYFHCGPNAVFINDHPDFIRRNKDGSIFYNNEWNFPSLNFESHELREYLWQNMEYYVRECDIDGYRCDVAFMVPLDFWEEGRRRIETIKTPLFMLSESDGNPQEQSFAFEASYGFAFKHKLNDLLLEKIKADEYRSIIQKLQESLADGRTLRGFDNHDIASDGYDQRPEKICPPHALDCALVFCYSLDGIPFIYNGQEVADTNRHSLWANASDCNNCGTDWSGALTPAGQSRMKLVQTLNRLRSELQILVDGDVQWIENDAGEAVLSFTRKLEGQNLLAIFNFRNAPLSTTLQTSIKTKNLQKILSYGSDIIHKEDCIRADLLPYGYHLTVTETAK